jgi:hypothetical protein
LISFPGVLRWFSSPSPASAPYIFRRGCRDLSRRVTPFGYRRIKGCVPLPAAFRSLPRPSSPGCAKASTCGPSSRLTILLFRRIPPMRLRLPPFPLGGFSGRLSVKYLFNWRYFSLEIRGFEPLTSSLQSWRSSQLSYIPDYCASSSVTIKNGTGREGFAKQTPGNVSERLPQRFRAAACLRTPAKGLVSFQCERR